MKEFKKTETDRGTGLTCPRTDCGSKFLVNLPEILDKKLGLRNANGRLVPVKTIVCPCCSRVSAIPAADLIERGHDPVDQTDGYGGR